MNQTNASKFFNELINLYRCVEEKVGAKCAQETLNKNLAHAISITSFVALGYFASQKCDPMLLGAGFATGALLSWIDTKSVLHEGAILPMDQKGYFALQKVCFIAMFLGKCFALPTGFFAGNAVYHYAATAISGR